MTRILALSPQMPYPPNNGGKEGIWGFCESLSQKGLKVTLLCASFRDCNTIIDNIEIIEYDYRILEKLKNIISSVMRRRHYKFDKYYNGSMQKDIRARLEFDSKTILLSFHPHMAVNFERIGLENKYYLRSHNIESDLVIDYIARKKVKFLSWLGILAQRHEISLWSKSRRVYFLNERDATRAIDLGLDPQKVSIAHEGIHPIPGSEHSMLVKKFKSMRIGYLYNSSAAQNVYNLTKFLKFFWIPSGLFDSGVKLLISGNSHELLTDVLGSNYQLYGIHSTGYLDDVTEFYKQITALVSPTFVGTGVRKKILESMNHCTPVIMTELDRRSLSYLPQDLLRTFSEVSEFSTEVLNLLADEEIYLKKCRECNNAIAGSASWDRCTREFLDVI